MPSSPAIANPSSSAVSGHAATNVTTEAVAHLARPQDVIDQVIVAASVSPQLHGFGGLHGGIGLAVALHAMLDNGFEAVGLRSLHARYERAIRDDITVALTATQRRPTVGSATAEVRSGARRCITATATFGAPTMTTTRSSPTMPPSGRPIDHAEFELPPGLVPFGQFIEIRPTIAERPFAGDESPHLAAWMRLRDDDAPIDLMRLIILLDALAPSAAAPMTDFVALPTIELTVRPTPDAHMTTSPWILLDARSNVSADGWIDESLDAWAPDGTHLASAAQLRVARTL